MSARQLLALGSAAILVAGCESGDVNIDPATNVTDSNNTTIEGGGGTTNPCASYQNQGGQTIQGTYDGTNCTYPSSFVDAGNHLRTDVTIPDLPDDGAHIFEGSLRVGEDFTDDTEMSAAGISEGGDGPILTIEAGATLAWESNEKFVVVNRGSQIFAVGTEDEPITFTSTSDLEGTVDPEAVQEWGGIVINGFGVTNACAYTGTRGADLALDGPCHVESEGSGGQDANHYGGDNDDDNSGRLEYVVVKHTGATVGPGDEINGITFGGVGRDTIVRNLETYSTYDDGIEMFGGALSFENYVGLYANDDTIDIDEGWIGTIDNALVIQSETDGHHCIESDGIGSYDEVASDGEVENVISQGLNSRPTINNLTCIVSPNPAETATHDPGAGWRFREGIFPTINDSIVVGSFRSDETPDGTDNYCLRIDDRAEQAAVDGDLVINSSIIGCHEPVQNPTDNLDTGTQTEEAWFTANGNAFATVPAAGLDATAAADTDLQLLEDAPPIYSIAYSSMAVDGTTPPPSDAPQQGDFIGGLSTGIPDWTNNWTYGIHEDNRGQPLWFE